MELYGRTGRNRVVIPPASGGSGLSDILYDNLLVPVIQGINGIIHILAKVFSSGGLEVESTDAMVIQSQDNIEISAEQDITLESGSFIGQVGYFTVSSDDTIDFDCADELTMYAGANNYIGAYLKVILSGTQGTEVRYMKSGATQAAAGAGPQELWKTAGHATLPDNVVMHGV